MRPHTATTFALVTCLVAALALPLVPGGTVAAVEVPPPAPEVVAGFTLTPLTAAPVPTALAFGPGDGDGPDLYATTLVNGLLRFSLVWTPDGPVVREVVTVSTEFSAPLGVVFDEAGNAFVADSHGNDETGRTDGRVSRLAFEGLLCTLGAPVGEANCTPQFATTPQVVVDGLPNGRHNTNHLRFGPDGLLYVTNGNPNDNGIDGGDADVLPVSGAILSVDAAVVTASPAVFQWSDGSGLIAPEVLANHAVNADFRSKVSVYATGLRNVYGIAFGPTGLGYTGMNGADIPSSQDALFRIETPGTDFGYPFCFNEGPQAGVGAQISVVTSPVFPGHDCTGVPPATALLGWHTCATGLDFPTPGFWSFPATLQNSVFVAECGPFQPDDTLAKTEGDEANLYKSTGHKVHRVALDGDGNAVSVHEFIVGLGLPTDVLFGPDGAMYVADAGGILRVAPAVPSAVLGAAPPVPVSASGTAFSPSALVVPAGTTVEWTAHALGHTVTTADSMADAASARANDRFNSDGNPDTFRAPLPQGATFRHTFNTPGEFWYFCEPHAGAGMRGSIRVVG